MWYNKFMRLKSQTIIRKIFPILLLLTDVLFLYWAFFDASATLLSKILFLSILELTLPSNIFMLRASFVGVANSLDIFFKNRNSKTLYAILFVNFDFIVVSVVFSFVISLFYLLCLILPIVHFLIIVMLFKYCNKDSQKIRTMQTNKYLGIGISGHYVFDGVDILSDKNHTKTNEKNIKLTNPFNQKFSCIAQEVLYVTGKDYKFYVATYKIDEIYTLIYMLRNKDALRYKLNKHIKEDFDLNKNIYLAYCSDKTENDNNDDFVYVQNKLRYKITNTNSQTEKSKVLIQQKTELPHLTSQNTISTWFGDSFAFNSRKEADMFVKFVIEEAKNGALDSEIWLLHLLRYTLKQCISFYKYFYIYCTNYW